MNAPKNCHSRNSTRLLMRMSKPYSVSALRFCLVFRLTLFRQGAYISAKNALSQQLGFAVHLKCTSVTLAERSVIVFHVTPMLLMISVESRHIASRNSKNYERHGSRHHRPISSSHLLLKRQRSFGIGACSLCINKCTPRKCEIKVSHRLDLSFNFNAVRVDTLQVYSMVC